ncbi:MAG: hypothetical protein QF619_01415 [Candidatus Binatia bacterium]|jgi:hypothetical protein|nr:hypothetical protein [Candidatus Binatia bacterium]
MPQVQRAFEPAWWHWPAVILVGIVALIGCAFLWLFASKSFLEILEKCSNCGGELKFVGNGFEHGIVPHLDDVVIGLLLVGVQVGFMVAIL